MEAGKGKITAAAPAAAAPAADKKKELPPAQYTSKNVTIGNHTTDAFTTHPV
jgi:hypothetical protein